MAKVIYILGQARCGSTVVGFALGNHKGFRNLGETSSWIWGRTWPETSDGKPFVFNLTCEPRERVWIDSSKSLWRLGQWLRSKHDVRVIWLKRNLWQCIQSRVKRNPPYSSRLKLYLTPVFIRACNYIYLKARRVSYVSVNLDDLRDNNKAVKEQIECFVGEKLPNLYKDCDVTTQHVITGNHRTVGQRILRLCWQPAFTDADIEATKRALSRTSQHPSKEG